jgi:hypothetical protein
VDDVNNIIKSVSGDVSGSLTLNEYTITVEFADDINSIILSKGASTVKLCVVYQEGSGSSAVDKLVALPITVQDCACCPTTVAFIVENAAYEGPDVLDGALALSQLATQFHQIPNAALCVFSTDQGNAITETQGNTWKEGTAFCAGAEMAAMGGAGWRLPNLAEMYYKLHPRSEFDPTGASGNNGRYFASTVSRSGSTSAALRFLYTYRDGAAGTTPKINTLGGTVESFNGRYRCVKTINK